MFPEATIVRPALMLGTEDRFFNEYARLAKLAPLVPLPDGGNAKLQPVRRPPRQRPLTHRLCDACQSLLMLLLEKLEQSQR